MDFKLTNEAISIKSENGFIEKIAPEKNDHFIDIVSDSRKMNAPFLYITVKSDFYLCCFIRPFFETTDNAGYLIAYENDDRRKIFDFENTDLGYPSIAAVVTQNDSDEYSGERNESARINLQIVHNGDNWCLHYSQDELTWKMVRYFRLALDRKIVVGISLQSYASEGCRGLFGKIEALTSVCAGIR